jgi:hypothetical protein
MNFPTQTLLMPVGPHFSVLDDSLIKGYYAKILSHIRKEFFPDEKDRVVKMELFRQISKHSAVF